MKEKIFGYGVQGDRFLLEKNTNLMEIILQMYLCISLHLVVTLQYLC